MNRKNMSKETAAARLMDYKIDATGHDVSLTFSTASGDFAFSVSHAAACRLAGRLLNQADFFACRRASTRQNHGSLSNVAAGLWSAVEEGNLTHGQAKKLFNKAQRLTGGI